MPDCVPSRYEPLDGRPTVRRTRNRPMRCKRRRESGPVASSEDKDPIAMLGDTVICSVNNEWYWHVVRSVTTIDRSKGTLQDVETLVLLRDVLAGGADAPDVLEQHDIRKSGLEDLEVRA